MRRRPRPSGSPRCATACISSSRWPMRAGAWRLSSCRTCSASTAGSPAATARWGRRASVWRSPGGSSRPTGTHPGHVRRAGPGHHDFLHPAGGRGARGGGLCRPWRGPPTSVPGRTGASPRPGGRRRSGGAALRARRTCRLGIRSGGDGRSGGAPRPHPYGEPLAGPARFGVARGRRHRADGTGPGAGRFAGRFHLGLRTRRDHRAGARSRSGRLHRQALLADRARGADPGRAAPAGRARALPDWATWRSTIRSAV